MAGLLYAKRVKDFIHGINKETLVTKEYLELLEDDLKRRMTTHVESNTGRKFLKANVFEQDPQEAHNDNGAQLDDKKTTGPQSDEGGENTPQEKVDNASKESGFSKKKRVCPQCGVDVKLKDLDCPECKICLGCNSVPCICTTVSDGSAEAALVNEPELEGNEEEPELEEGEDEPEV